MKQTKTLDTVRRQAQALTRKQGHRMTWGLPFGNATTGHFGQFGQCRDCGAVVYVKNHSDIGQYFVQDQSKPFAIEKLCAKGKVK